MYKNAISRIYSGKIGRLKFFSYMVVTFLLGGYFSSMFSLSEEYDFLVVLFLLVFPCSIFAIKRLRDIDINPIWWWFIVFGQGLLYFVPNMLSGLALLFFMLFLTLKKGVFTKNGFRLIPEIDKKLVRREKGFYEELSDEEYDYYLKKEYSETESEKHLLKNRNSKDIDLEMEQAFKEINSKMKDSTWKGDI